MTMDIVSVRLVRYAENARRAVQRFSLSRSSAFVDIIKPVFEHPEVLPDSMVIKKQRRCPIIETPSSVINVFRLTLFES